MCRQNNLLQIEPLDELSETFESFAQNGEDVMLWRCFRHIKHGFYIDVGAAEPEADSVTNAFYRRGWRGINIEPTRGAFNRLNAARPEDINLNIAISNKDTDSVPLFLVDGGNGLSTLDATYAEKLRGEGWKVEEVSIPAKTLSTVCAKYGIETAHFLKIDVECSEKAVLEGINLKIFRPWVILLEATLPNPPNPAPQQWEELLLAANYEFVWFDGLNMFYIPQERKEQLLKFFSTPINLFDRVVRHSEVATRLQLTNTTEELQRHQEQFQARSAEVSIQVSEKTAQLSAIKAELDAKQAELDAKQAELDAKNSEISNLIYEQNIWEEEVFEANRYAMQVALERQKAIELVGLLKAHEQELELTILDKNTALQATTTLLEAVYTSTSWRGSAPIRCIGRLVRRR